MRVGGLRAALVELGSLRLPRGARIRLSKPESSMLA